MFLYVCGGCLDVCVDVSLGGWWLGGCMERCVVRCAVIVWIYVKMCQ